MDKIIEKKKGIAADTFHGKNIALIFEKTSTRAFIGHFLHRTAEIYVEHIGACRLGNECRLHHRTYLFAVNLNGCRPLGFVNTQLAGCAIHIAD